MFLNLYPKPLHSSLWESKFINFVSCPLALQCFYQDFMNLLGSFKLKSLWVSTFISCMKILNFHESYELDPQPSTNSSKNTIGLESTSFCLCNFSLLASNENFLWVFSISWERKNKFFSIPFEFFLCIKILVLEGKSCAFETFNALFKFCDENTSIKTLFHNFFHYYKKGPYCDPNILANNKEIRFWKPAVPNKNSSQTFKPLRNPHLRTRTIASSWQLPKLNPSQHISDYNVFYTRFAIHSTSKIIENKPNIAMT